ncbi:E3 ubiquitin-protein ligase MBR1-like [Vicia villosa]|uniref:E3 ubiquitin-protein ligase MBR1-like n=1 Tax=Vicia villosa TaxID=3911 RepID=UPI00273C956F|nr:E3 ubiquitin-protein ligase MBR1-like [Vicia villosa]
MDDDERGSRKRIRGNHQPSNPLEGSSNSSPNIEGNTDEVTVRDTSSSPMQHHGNNNGARVPLTARQHFRRPAILDVPSNHSDGVMPETSLNQQRNLALIDEMENSLERRHARLNIDGMEDALIDEVEHLIDQHQHLISLIEEMSDEDFALFNEMEHPVDQHQDMRLNIDGMSYEELIQLGERIGSVSTGLSEETIARQLKTKDFSPSPIAINLEELPPEEGDTNSCIICQEEFKNQEKIGVIKCEHEYHVDCITQWLLLKNSCPICKVEALEALNDG